MTVRAIRLENFMAFADTDWIELLPISLLFGRNSSGKSAFIRALRLLKQSRTSPPDALPTQFPLTFFREHGLDQGGFENTVNLRQLEVEEREQDPPVRNPRQRVITFHLRCEFGGDVADKLLEYINRYLVETEQPAITPGAAPNPRWVDLSLGFAHSYDDDDDVKDWRVELVRLDITCPWPVLATKLVVFGAARTGWEDIGDKTEDQKWWWPREWVAPYSDLLFDEDWNPNSPADNPADLLMLPLSGFLATMRAPLELLQVGALKQTVGMAFIARLMAELSTVIYQFLKDIQYLGPVRPEPERLYRFNAVDATAWREAGWGSYLDFLSLKLSDTSLIDQIGEWFDYLDLGPAVRPEAVGLGQGFLSQVSVFENSDGVPYNLRDVGFGASQVLPVIVQSLLARPGSLVIIEQPELHLHPHAQAQLADSFLRAIYSHKRGIAECQSSSEEHGYDSDKDSALKPSGVHFLLETHSEHLLLRFQRRIAETRLNRRAHNQYKWHLTESDLCACLVDRKDGVSTCELILVNEWGEFVTEPEGFVEFFGDDFAEVMKMGQARSEWEGEQDNDIVM